MDLFIIEKKSTDISRFIDFWSQQYDYGNDQLYDENIGKLTEESIKQLFAWKNGSKEFNEIAKRKRESIEKNYIGGLKTLPPADERSIRKFLRQPGGAIWRIFWLHCLTPEKYPIFDQHVYRAMCYLKKGIVEELPNSNPQKIDIYIDEYLPFWKEIKTQDLRKLDRALWQFGRFIRFVGKIDKI